MRLRLVCIAASILAGATLPVSAQQPEVARAPDRGAHGRVPGIIVSPVANLPFSGRDNIEWTRKLDDGSSLTQHLDAVVARDNQGRIYPRNPQLRRRRFQRNRRCANVFTTASPHPHSLQCVQQALRSQSVQSCHEPRRTAGRSLAGGKSVLAAKVGQRGRKPRRGWHARNADHRCRRRRQHPAPGQHQGILVFARTADQRLGDPPVAHRRHPGDPAPRGLAARSGPTALFQISRVPVPAPSLDARPQHRRPLRPSHASVIAQTIRAKRPPRSPPVAAARPVCRDHNVSIAAKRVSFRYASSPPSPKKTN